MGLFSPRSPTWYDGKPGLVLECIWILAAIGFQIAGAVLFNSSDEEDDPEYQAYNVDLPLIIVGTLLLVIGIFFIVLRHNRSRSLKRIGFGQEPVIPLQQYHPVDIPQTPRYHPYDPQPFQYHSYPQPSVHGSFCSECGQPKNPASPCLACPHRFR